MIFVSSSCVKKDTIKESVYALVQEGYRNIELSGGTRYYDAYIDDLLELKDKYQLNYIIHNYFPPPQEHFILNIATFNDDFYQKSIEHCLRAIELCKVLGCNKYAIHAGFLIDFTPEEAGKKISLRKVNDRNVSLDRFASAWKKISDSASDDVNLYIENNVYSKTNFITYESNNPFLLTDYEGYLELADRIDFKVLLDLAHLKVSCNTLGLDFFTQAEQMLSKTDYIHISGNDGLHDQNEGIDDDLDVIRFLNESDLSGKTLTLEIYNGFNSIRSSFDKLESLKKNN